MVSKTVVSIKFWIIKHQIISTVYFPHQTGIIIHATIPKLDQLSAEQKLLVILFCLRQLETLLDFIWSTASSTFGNNVSGLKLLTRLCVGFSHLREINLNIVFEIDWTRCALVLLKQKTPITFFALPEFF